MAARDEDVPRFAHLFAVAGGLFCLPVMYGFADFVMAGLLGDIVTGFADAGPGDLIPVAVFFAVAHAALGGVFGLLWPEKTWRWGVWLCAVPTCAASLLAGSVWDFARWEAVTLLPACAGAYAAARFHLKFAKVEESE